ncbi:MAG: hypothetical protein PHN84_02755 [Desulfuromonadaceae bacterium]|nr:hypothetical protein [Desulfuromonadaceae bacterium]MDD2854709.1 hypothetical protein [Desulfuromonadaceae bacterium]
MSNPLTKQEIQELAEAWYRKLDVHAPMIEVLPMLSDEGLEMRFPEATLTTMAEFESWYQRVIRIFFDEVHLLKEVTADIDGETANVHIVVEWQASVWNPPSANSERIKLDADQSWQVKRSSDTGKAVISVYTVNELNYHQGSARL